MKFNIRNFRNNSLSGSIPESIRNLNQLTYLDLSNNQLTGLFPEWIHSLSRLKLLNLGQNHFSVQIPLFIGGHLKILRLFSIPQKGTMIDLKLFARVIKDFSGHIIFGRRAQTIYFG